MPRPRICRCIGAYPDHWSFAPQDDPGPETVTMSLDEYESIRLIDYNGLNQEQCAQQMGVARTTVTAIYESARKKIAEGLIGGKVLRIEGGNYRLIGHEPVDISEKGENAMRVAVTYDSGEIFQHFGKTGQFKFFDISDGKIINSQVVDTNGSGHGALAGFLKAAGADALICGGIGPGAQNALREAGISLYAGVTGDADAAAAAFAAGTLQYSEAATCDHHDHEHEGHDCGHSCHQ